MELQYQVSAAGASAGSLMEQIKNNSLLEESQYKMLTTATQTYIEVVQATATNTEQSIIEQAESMRANAIAQMVGGALSAAATIGSVAMSMHYENAANNALKVPDEEVMNVQAEEIENIPNTTNTDTVAVKGSTTEAAPLDKSTSPQTKTPADVVDVEEESVTVEANKKSSESAAVDKSVVNEDEKAEDNKQESDEKAEKARKNAAKALSQKAGNWLQIGPMMGQSMNSIATSAGGMSAAGYTQAQAGYSGLQALYQGQQAVWNNMFSLTNGIIGSAEQAKQGDAQIWASIVQATRG